MNLYLVHHGVAVGPEVDARRPLSPAGLANVERLAAQAARSARSRRSSGTAASCARSRRPKPTGARATRSRSSRRRAICSPTIRAQWIRDRLRGETRDILIAGHFTHLPRLLSLLVVGGEAGVEFPINGVVALTTEDAGETWREVWRLKSL